MSRQATWEEVIERFNPTYVTPAEQRAPRPGSPADKIIKALDTAAKMRKPNNMRILVAGTVGTGKTTELLRLLEARKDREFVVFLDLAQAFVKLGRSDGLQHVTPWEICFLAGLTVYRTAEERIGFPFPKHVLKDLESAWIALADASETPRPPQLDLVKLMKAVVEAAAIVGFPAKPVNASIDALHLIWNLPMGASKTRLPDDAEPVKNMLNAFNQVIGEIQGKHHRILLVIDGLDRIHNIDRARELFIESDVLGRLACHVVLCGPFALRHHPAVTDLRGFQYEPLVNEPVLDQRDPAKPGPGLAFFRELFRLRTRDLGGPELIASPLLDRLVYYSGGRARHFVKMVHRVASDALLAEVDAATDDIVDDAIDEERKLAEAGLHTGHSAILEAVMRDPRHRLPDHELVWDLLDLSRLLPYPDHSEWFYPHPLLTLYWLAPAGSTG
jgi:hypothetical protein